MSGRIEEGCDELDGGDDVGLNSFLDRWRLGDDILIAKDARNRFRLNLCRRSQSTFVAIRSHPTDENETKTNPYFATLLNRSAPTPKASHLPPSDPGGFELVSAPIRGEGGIELTE